MLWYGGGGGVKEISWSTCFKIMTVGCFCLISVFKRLLPHHVRAGARQGLKAERQPSREQSVHRQ